MDTPSVTTAGIMLRRTQAAYCSNRRDRTAIAAIAVPDRHAPPCVSARDGGGRSAPGEG